MHPSSGDVFGHVAPPEDRSWTRARYGALAVVVTVLTIIQTLNGQWSTDMWEHVAVVRELIAHPFDPSHPQLLSDATHPDFSPYTVVLGMLGNLLGADAVTVLSCAAVVNVVLLLIAFRLLVIEVTANHRAPFWALLFMLTLWGVGPYRYSGFFSLNSIGFVAPYPSTFAAAVGFGTLVAAIRFARTGGRVLLVHVAVGAALVLLIHPLSAPWLALALLAIVVGEVRDRRCVAWFAGAGAGAVALGLLWPYFPLLELVGDSTSLEALNKSMYSNVVIRVFPALLGLAVIVRRSTANHYDLLGLFLAGSLVLYVVGGVTGNTSFGRSLAFIVIVLHIALADGVARIEATNPWRGADSRLRVGAGALACLVALGLVTTRGGLIRMVPSSLLPTSTRESKELVRPDEQYDFLARLVGPNEVTVGSRPADNRVIPAIAGRTLALGVPRPFVEDAAARKRAERTLLDPATTESVRAAIQDRFVVRFALLNVASDRVLLESLKRAGATEIHRDDELVLVELP